jgi:hypothetical protein
VGENTWLKRWAEGRKCEDDMKVDQELDLDGRAENGRNLGRAIPQTHLLFLKNQPVEVSGYSGLHITTYWTTDRRKIGSRKEKLALRSTKCWMAPVVLRL